MNLIIDCAFSYLTIALVDQNHCYIYHQKAHLKQSELLVPTLKHLAKTNNVLLEQLTAIYVGIGPGSFTGTRIALTCAKTLSYSFQLPLYTFNSFQLLTGINKQALAVYPAKSNCHFYGVYDHQTELEVGVANLEVVLAKYPNYQLINVDQTPPQENFLAIIEVAQLDSCFSAKPRYL